MPSGDSSNLTWGIYHRDREFAREVGDPCLGVVQAPDKEAAEGAASKDGIYGLTGLWAHPLDGETFPALIRKNREDELPTVIATAQQTSFLNPQEILDTVLEPDKVKNK